MTRKEELELRATQWLQHHGDQRLTRPLAALLEEVEREHDQAQRTVIESLRNLCLEAYQVVGSLASDAGMFGHPATTKVLDNLSMAGTGKPLPHKELLPYPASQKIEQQAKENKTLREALQSIVESEGLWTKNDMAHKAQQALKEVS